MPPKPLQIIITTSFIEENVANQVAIVLKDPFAVIVPFQADREFAPTLHLEIDFIADGLILARVGTGTDEEVIGKAGNLSQIEDYQI